MRVLVCVTIYSENFEDLTKTLDGIYSNLHYFQKINISDEDIACIIIFDGCKPMHGLKI